MSLDMTSFDAALKQHYTDDMVENLVYKDNPLLALMAKMEDFGGRNLPIPLIRGNPQNRSATFSVAQGGTTTSKLDAFLLTRVKDYSIATIDNETLEASKGNANAFLEAATVEIDGAINALTRSLAVKLYRSGFGSVGNVNATVTGTTLTLLDANDVVNFEVGDVLQFAASDGGDALRDSGDSVAVTAVNRSAGSMTVGTLSGITGLTSGDFIFKKGDRQDSGTPSRIVVAGLEAWCPGSAPASTAFFGVDRTSDVTRLGGLRLDASSVPIEEALIGGASLVAREGGKIDHYMMSYAQFSALEKALGTKVQYVDVKMNAEIGFRGILVNGPRGPIKVIPDQNCPSNRVFGLQLNTWKLYSLGKAVRVIDTDGLQMLRQASADGVEVRYGFYGNAGCRAPGWNINLQVTSPTTF
jgi:hypothetical protein